jgi:tetratricopeptide (TPR) repeat protein
MAYYKKKRINLSYLPRLTQSIRSYVIATQGSNLKVLFSRYHCVSSNLLPKFSHYGLIALLSVVLVSESVGARATLAQLQIAQQPTTIQPDATRAEAMKLMKEGVELFKQGTAESLVAARNKWEQALILWQKLDDKKLQATTLSNIGRVYDDLGDKQQALKFYNQSLPLYIEVGDKSGQAITLSNIGGVYSDLGDKQQALKFYNQSLPLRIEVGDKSGTARTLNNIGAVYSSLGDKQQALEFYKQSRTLYCSFE